MTYQQVYDKEWNICEKEFRLACCSCSLVHDVYFRVRIINKKPVLEMRMDRNERATAALRRKRK